MNKVAEQSDRGRALADLGAAPGSNCVPRVEQHVPLARKTGLSDEEIEVERDEPRRSPTRRRRSTRAWWSRT
jgi:hypothetical protein